MVMFINKTYCGNHSVIHTNTELYCHTPETNVTIYVNYINQSMKYSISPWRQSPDIKCLN